MKLSVIGLGKLGLPFVYFLASHGYEILGFDKNNIISKLIKKNKSPYIEPFLQKRIKKYKKKVKICESIDELMHKTNITFLILPTPSNKNGSFSNKHILSVLNIIGRNLKNKKNSKHLINITSTVMPMSCEREFIPYLEKNFGLTNNKDFIITYNPHFIAQGTTFYNLKNPDILLMGSDAVEGKRILLKVYNKIYKNKSVFKHLSLLEAEITKLSVNAYVTNKISFSNYISSLCEKVENTNASLILDVIGQDKRIGRSYMKVGTRFSGPCFPRDNKALAFFTKKVNCNYNILDSVDKFNSQQTHRLVKIINFFAQKFNKRLNVGILGMSYKKDTNIISDSQGYELLKKISSKKLKINKTIVFDPYIKKYNDIGKFKSVFISKSIVSLVRSSDIILIMYKDDLFLRMQNIKPNKKKIIIDCWAQLKKVRRPFMLHTLGKSLRYQ